MAYLALSKVADFNELKSLRDATQGNLSVHLRKLGDAGYVRIEKSLLGRKPLTRAWITAAGARPSAAIWRPWRVWWGGRGRPSGSRPSPG